MIFSSRQICLTYFMKLPMHSEIFYFLNYAQITLIATCIYLSIYHLISIYLYNLSIYLPVYYRMTWYTGELLNMALDIGNRFSVAEPDHFSGTGSVSFWRIRISFIFAEPDPFHFCGTGSVSFQRNRIRFILAEPDPFHFGGSGSTS